MTWLIRCWYRPGGAQARLPLRAQHIRHMLAWLPKTVFGAAAMLDETTREPSGMVVVLGVDTRAEAQSFINTEPYCRAGLFASVELTPLRQMTPPLTPDLLLGELQQCLEYQENHE